MTSRPVTTSGEAFAVMIISLLALTIAIVLAYRLIKRPDRRHRWRLPGMENETDIFSGWYTVVAMVLLALHHSNRLIHFVSADAMSWIVLYLGMPALLVSAIVQAIRTSDERNGKQDPTPTESSRKWGKNRDSS